MGKNLTSIAFPNLLFTLRFRQNGELIIIDEYPSSVSISTGIGMFFSFFGTTLAHLRDTTKYDYFIIPTTMDAETDNYTAAPFYSVGHIYDITDIIFPEAKISLTYRYDDVIYSQDMGLVSYAVSGLPGPTDPDSKFKKNINSTWYWCGNSFKETIFNETYPLVFSNSNVIDLTEAYFAEFEDDLDPSINIYNKVKCRVYLSSKQLAELKLNSKIVLNFGKGESAYYRISKMSTNLDGNNPTTMELIRLNKY